MDTQIVVFCSWDDKLKSWQHCEDRQLHMSESEVMTNAILAM